MDRVNLAISRGNETAIRELIDVPSFVDMYILQELAKNPDVGAASFYYTKDVDGKLMASPPWDFDRGFGNDTRGQYATGLNVATGASDSDGTNENAHKFYIQLLKMDWFKEEVQKRFTALYKQGAFAAISTKYDWDSWKNSAAVKANWSESAMVKEKGYSISNKPNYYGKINPKGSIAAEVDDLSDWIEKRIAVLKNAYYVDPDAPSSVTVEIPAVVDGEISENAELINGNLIGTTEGYINAGDYPEAVVKFTVPDTLEVGDVITVVVTGGTQGYGYLVVYDDNKGSVGSEIYAKRLSNASGDSWHADHTITLTVGEDVVAGGTYYAGVKADEFINLDGISVTYLEKTNKYDVSVVYDSTIGTVTGAGKYKEGEAVTLTAEGIDEYITFDGWYDNAEFAGDPVFTEATYTISSLTADTTLYAKFTDTATRFTVTVNANDNTMGTVSGAGKYVSGTSAKLTATPAKGYEFVGWLKNDGTEYVAETLDYIVKIDEDVTFTAVFQGDIYEVKAKSNNTDAGEATAKLTSAGSNEYTMTATVKDNENYKFLNWTTSSGAVISTDATFTYKPEGDIAVYANFVEKYVSITPIASPAEGGTVEATGTKNDAGKFEYGKEATLKATPNDGYYFLRWVDANGEFVSNEAEIKVTATGNETYTAEFVVIAEEPEEGTYTDTITLEAEDYAYKDRDVTIRKDADTSGGECILTGSDNGLEGSGFYPITLPEGATYTIYVCYENAGHPEADFDWHRNQWLNIYTAGKGTDTYYDGTYYGKTRAIQLNGQHYSFTEKRVLTDVAAGDYVLELFGRSYSQYDYIKIVASRDVFGGATVTVTPTCNEEYGTVSGGGSVVYGTECTVKAEGNSEYTFLNWTLNGKVVSEDASYTFTAYEDTAPVANFAKIQWVIIEAENFADYVSERTDSSIIKVVDNKTADEESNYDKTFSNGEAVELSGNSSAIAVPFTIGKTNDEFDIWVGYDYGNLQDWKDDGYDCGLWINIYVPKGSTVNTSAWEEAGWSTDGSLKAPTDDFDKSDFQAVYYLHLDKAPETGEMKITIPENAGAGDYYISVATDSEWNLYGRGVGYYDYLKFIGGSVEGVTVGAAFFFTDMFGNILRSSEYSETSFEDHTITFSPKVPLYLLTQGYDIVRWEYFDNEGNFHTIDLTNSNFEEPSTAINSLKFPSGSNITFKAIYEVAVDLHNIVVENGTMYVCDPATGKYTVALEKALNYKAPNFGQVRIEAEETNVHGEDFSYWTLNGFIYSYDRDIMFSAWTDANFAAVYGYEVEAKPVAFTDINVIVSGFETEDTNKHKVTFDCAYYIPEGYSVYKIGIYYAGASGKDNLARLEDCRLTGAPTTPANCARLDVDYSKLVNNQTMVSLYGTRTGLSRSARAFIIYQKDGGSSTEYYITYSDCMTTVSNLGNPSDNGTNEVSCEKVPQEAST